MPGFLTNSSFANRGAAQLVDALEQQNQVARLQTDKQVLPPFHIWASKDSAQNSRGRVENSQISVAYLPSDSGNYLGVGFFFFFLPPFFDCTFGKMSGDHRATRLLWFHLLYLIHLANLAPFAFASLLHVFCFPTRGTLHSPPFDPGLLLVLRCLSSIVFRCVRFFVSWLQQIIVAFCMRVRTVS